MTVVKQGIFIIFGLLMAAQKKVANAIVLIQKFPTRLKNIGLMMNGVRDQLIVMGVKKPLFALTMKKLIGIKN